MKKDYFSLSLDEQLDFKKNECFKLLSYYISVNPDKFGGHFYKAHLVASGVLPPFLVVLKKKNDVVRVSLNLDLKTKWDSFKNKFVLDKKIIKEIDGYFDLYEYYDNYVKFSEFDSLNFSLISHKRDYLDVKFDFSRKDLVNYFFHGFVFCDLRFEKLSFFEESCYLRILDAFREEDLEVLCVELKNVQKIGGHKYDGYLKELIRPYAFGKNKSLPKLLVQGLKLNKKLGVKPLRVHGFVVKFFYLNWVFDEFKKELLENSIEELKSRGLVDVSYEKECDSLDTRFSDVLVLFIVMIFMLFMAIINNDVGFSLFLGIGVISFVCLVIVFVNMLLILNKVMVE